MPAIIEGDELGTYVLKFRGAGQGPKALIAEIIGGEIARALGLRMPELVFVQLDQKIGRNEPDYEIRELINSSEGLNLGMDYLPGSITFDPVANTIDPALASAIVWFDAFIMNVDRTARNTNMLMWHKRLYLIDHGASLFLHHNWATASEKFSSPFAAIKDHVLLRFASKIESAAKELKSKLTSNVINDVVRQVPEEWLTGEAHFNNVEDHYRSYESYLSQRLEASSIFEEEIQRARAALI